MPNWEEFGKHKSKVVKKLIADLMTNGAGSKATRLVLWNDNAHKYNDLGGYSPAALYDIFTKFYDAAFKDGEKHTNK